MKKILSAALKVFTVLLVAFTVFMMIFTILSVTTVDKSNRNILGFKFYIVQSDSMSLSDKNADVIIVEEKDFALWYRDLSEDLEFYDGKRVRFVGQVVVDRSIPEHCFVVGRPLMTCCADDIQFAGLVCEWKQSKDLTSRDWVRVTAGISVRKHACYGRVGPVLEGVDVAKCDAPAEEVASFY